jgi:hypothetical protein
MPLTRSTSAACCMVIPRLRGVEAQNEQLQLGAFRVWEVGNSGNLWPMAPVTARSRRACKRPHPRYRAGSSVLKDKGWRVWTRVTKVVKRAWRLRWCKPASRARRSRSLPMVPRIGRAGRNLLNRRYRIDEFASSLVTIPGSNRGHPSASRGHHLLSTVFRSAVISRRCGGTDVVRAPPSAAPASPSGNRRLRDGSLLRFGDLVLGRRLGEELHQRAVHFVRVSPNHCVRSIFNDQEFGALHQLRRAMPSG